VSEGRHDEFDPAYYLLVHGDVGDSGMDPADHFRKFGASEGRTGRPPGGEHPLEREMSDRYDFFRHAWSALATNGISGDYAEFGVGHGKTLWCSWRSAAVVGLRPRLWGFDSFAGLPESEDPADRSHPAWRPGAFSVDEARVRRQCEHMGIPDDQLALVAGDFRESLDPSKREALPRDVALAYIDCDLFVSTVAVLDYVSSILKHGMILGFDDWHCWSSSSRSGEMLAFDAFAAEHAEFAFEPYLSIGWHGRSFVVLTA
jgi:O-methyltransferase